MKDVLILFSDEKARNSEPESRRFPLLGCGPLLLVSAQTNRGQHFTVRHPNLGQQKTGKGHHGQIYIGGT